MLKEIDCGELWEDSKNKKWWGKDTALFKLVKLILSIAERLNEVIKIVNGNGDNSVTFGVDYRRTNQFRINRTVNYMSMSTENVDTLQQLYINIKDDRLNFWIDVPVVDNNFVYDTNIYNGGINNGQL